MINGPEEVATTFRHWTLKRLLCYRWSNLCTRTRKGILEDGANRGLGGPPNNWHYSAKFTSRQHGSSTGHEWWALNFDNDAFDVQIATKYNDAEHSQWSLFMAAEDFRKLALWYLWRWAWGEWFGLRRKLFYWDLHRRCEKMRQNQVR